MHHLASAEPGSLPALSGRNGVDRFRARLTALVVVVLAASGTVVAVPSAHAGPNDPVVIELPDELRALPRGVWPLGHTDDGHTVFDYEADPLYRSGGFTERKIVSPNGAVSSLGDEHEVQTVVGNRLVQESTDTSVTSRLVSAGTWITQTVPSGHTVLDYTVDGIVVRSGELGAHQLGLVAWGSNVVLPFAGVPAGTSAYPYARPVHDGSWSVLSVSVPGGTPSGDKLVLDSSARKAWVLPVSNPDCPASGYQGLAVNEGVLVWMTQLPSTSWVLCTTDLPAAADSQAAAPINRPMTRLPDGIVTGNTEYRLLPVGGDVVVAASDAHRTWGTGAGEPVLATAPDGTTRILAPSGHSIVPGPTGQIVVVTGSAPGQASLRKLTVSSGASVEAMPIAPVRAWYSGIAIDGTTVLYADDSAALGGARRRAVDFGAGTAGPSTLLDEDVQAPVAVGQSVAAWSKSGFQGKWSSVLLGNGTRITTNSYQPRVAEQGWARFDGQLMKLPSGTTSLLADNAAFQDGVSYQPGGAVGAAANAVVAKDAVTNQTRTIVVPACTSVGNVQVAGSWLSVICPDGPTALKHWVVDRTGATPTQVLATGGQVYLGNGYALLRSGSALSWTSLSAAGIAWKPLGTVTTSNDELEHAVAVSRGAIPSVAWFDGRTAQVALLPVATSALPDHPGVLAAPPAPGSVQVALTPSTGAATVSWTWSAAAEAETVESFSVDSGDVHLTGLAPGTRSVAIGVPPAGSRPVVVTAVGATRSSSGQLASFAFPGPPEPLQAPPAPSAVQVTVAPSTGAATVTWSWTPVAGSETAASFSVDSGDVHLTGLSASARSASLGVPPAGTRSVVVTAVGATTSSSGQLASFVFPGPPGPLPAIISSNAPVITGKPKIGAPLTASTGTWSPAGTYSYQWFLGNAPIATARKATYVPTPGAVGKRLRVEVTATKTGYSSTTVSSALSAIVLKGTFVNKSVPTISGLKKVGRTLTATPGAWNLTGLTFRYQWLRDGKVVAGATGRTYKLTAASRGHRMKVRVTASRSGYASVVTSSTSTAKVTR